MSNKSVAPLPVTAAVKKVVEDLRASPSTLDEMSIARMERAVVQGWRARAARVEPLSQRRSAGPSARTLRGWGFATLMAGSAAFGAVLALRTIDEAPSGLAAASAAQFEMRMSEGATQRGTVREGQTLESGRHGRIQVDVGQSRVEISPRSRVRFDRLGADAVQLTVVEGRIDATFNPAHDTGRSMAVETRAARVEVVGTRFVVNVDSQGNTRVAVREGIVDVLPKEGVRERLTAGQRTEVLLDTGDSTEQAIRASLSAELAASESGSVFGEAETRVEAEAPADLEFEMVEVEAMASSGKRAAGAARPSRETAERRLERARLLLRQGKHVAARRKLLAVANAETHSAHNRAEAWTLVAESFTAQGQVPKAADAYRAAVESGRGTNVGHNALFALARLLERYRQDTDGARVAYERYVSDAPHGALAGQAKRALCRLGVEQRCKSGR